MLDCEDLRQSSYPKYGWILKGNFLAGVKELTVLKTTQSGYEGFLKDQYTVLKDTAERMVATSITANWRYFCTDAHPLHAKLQLASSSQ